MSHFDIPLFIRGKLIEDNWVEFGGRGPASQFRAVDISNDNIEIYFLWYCYGNNAGIRFRNI